MWRRRTTIAAYVLATALSVARSDAQEARPIVAVGANAWNGPQPTTAEAGGSVTLPLQFVNSSADSLFAKATIDLPKDWQVRLPLRSVALAPGESANRLVLIRLPAGTTAGDYLVRVVVSDQESKVLQILERSVRVQSVCGLALTAAAATRYVEAGGGVVASVSVRNQANVPLTIDLDTRSPAGYEVVIESRTIAVDIGRVEVVPLFVRTPREVLRQIRRSVVITATSTDCPAVRKTAAVSFDVVPSPRSELQNSVASIPGHVTFVGGTGNGGAGGQVEVVATGPVDARAKRRLGFQAVFPDQGRLRFGEQSRLTATFHSETVNAEVGDIRAGFSRLTQVPGRGRGVKLESTLGPMVAGAFWARPRFGFPVRSYAGGSASFRVSSSALVGLNYLGQTGIDRRQSLTLMGSYEPSEVASVSLEIGDAMRGGSAGEALAIEASGALDKRLFYSGRVVRAGPGFPGQFSDYDFRQGSVAYRPADGLSVQLTGRIEGQTFQSAVEGEEWRRRGSSFRVGLGIHERNASALLFATQTRRDAGGELFHDASENDAGAELRISHKLVAGGLNLRIGQYRDRARGASDTFTRFSLSTSVGTERNALSLAFERLDGRTIGRPLEGDVVAGRVSLRLSPFDRTTVEIDAYGSRDGFWDEGIYHLLHARAAQRFDNGSKLEAKVQYGSLGASTGTAYVDVGIRLSVPIKVPNPFALSSRQVRGRLVDYETGRPFSGVLMQLGDRVALSDASGSFRFKKPDVGQHLLRIDMSTAGVEYVPMATLPLRMDIGREDVPEVEIALARSAVALMTFARKRSPDAGRDVPEWLAVDAAVIEIEDSYGRLRAVTNVAGRVTFSGIRPGEYTVRVVYAELPEDYRMERDEYAFSVAPGERGSIDLRAVPKRRNIQIISSGELTLGEIAPIDADSVSAVRVDGVTSEDNVACRARPSWVHVVTAGESLSSIARTVYGDMYLWPFLWLPNKEAIPDPDRIEVGERLVVTRGEYRVHHEEQVHTTASLPVTGGESAQEIAESMIGHRLMWPVIWYLNRDSVESDGAIRSATTATIPPIRVEEIDSLGVCDD